VVAVLFAAVTVSHYTEVLSSIPVIGSISPSVFGMDRHATDRLCYALLAVYAGWALGFRARVLVLGLSLAVMLPRAILISPAPRDALYEIFAASVLSALLLLLIREMRRTQRDRDELDATIRRVISAQEDERKRIARELHDDTAQSLLLIMHQIDALASDPKITIPDDARLKLAKLYSVAQTAHQSVRRYARDLRPAILDDLGLGPALEWLADNLATEKGVDVRVRLGNLQPPPPHDTQIALFRIAQEAIANIAQHAKATRMTMTMTAVESVIRLTITDDGAGFDASIPGNPGATAKFGIAGMKERAQAAGGTLAIHSGTASGTTVVVEVPRKP